MAFLTPIHGKRPTAQIADSNIQARDSLEHRDWDASEKSSGAIGIRGCFIKHVNELRRFVPSLLDLIPL
jgi:hypothetical protein